MLSRLQGSRALKQGLLTHNAASGVVISLIGYTMFVLFPAIDRLLDFHSSTIVFIGYYGSALLIGLGNGHMWPAFQNMTINVAHNNQRGTANSTILVSWDIGIGLGVLIGGVIAEYMGYDAAFWSTMIVNAVGVATFFLATQSFFLRRNLNTSVK